MANSQPINDPRPFAEVLADWMRRHGLTAYAAGKVLPVSAVAIRKWLNGAPCPAERSHRALMTLVDDGRIGKDGRSKS